MKETLKYGYNANKDGGIVDWKEDFITVDINYPENVDRKTKYELQVKAIEEATGLAKPKIM